MIINIYNLLEKKKKSRYWLAKQIGVTPITLRNLADGKTISVKFDILEKLCIALDCTLNDLIEFESTK